MPTDAPHLRSLSAALGVCRDRLRRASTWRCWRTAPKEHLGAAARERPPVERLQ